MTKTSTALLMALSLLSVPVATLPALADSNCNAAVVCGNTAPHKVFHGDQHPKNTIEVTVCHRFWDQLDVGELNGRQTKWWGPTMRYKSWHVDLAAVPSQCKTYTVTPGTVIDSFASCVDRIVTTESMTVAGHTYWLE